MEKQQPFIFSNKYFSPFHLINLFIAPQCLSVEIKVCIAVIYQASHFSVQDLAHLLDDLFIFVPWWKIFMTLLCWTQEQL